MITKPEITKNTSTPMKPPPTNVSEWNATTSSTARPRSAWMSARWVEVPARGPATLGPATSGDDDRSDADTGADARDARP